MSLHPRARKFSKRGYVYRISIVFIAEIVIKQCVLRGLAGVLYNQRKQDFVMLVLYVCCSYLGHKRSPIQQQLLPGCIGLIFKLLFLVKIAKNKTYANLKLKDGAQVHVAVVG